MSRRARTRPDKRAMAECHLRSVPSPEPEWLCIDCDGIDDGCVPWHDVTCAECGGQMILASDIEQKETE